ncbi:MAG: ATP-dependent Clp protease adaptor ClpS [candidate division KSB1 bacterium]|nr:ATP-dependent Clp protease adaptor ClpS [candidate division KSB1 bacterium]MDZ7301949.1 ATP-dependent Clp protease adaptor ClpS [candidate division KSB1 bacterium]MDZ7312354.1 ATP-dependent Clp protease adaptor ClpS [candidate division KSB1 bacterium]
MNIGRSLRQRRHKLQSARPKTQNAKLFPFGLSLSLLRAALSPFEEEDVLIDEDIGTRIGEPWKVVLYNDNIHTFDEVILQLQKATGCSVQRAEQIAFEAHTKGKAVAFSGEFNECFRVAGVLREIQLIVEIEG